MTRRHPDAVGTTSSPKASTISRTSSISSWETLPSDRTTALTKPTSAVRSSALSSLSVMACRFAALRRKVKRVPERRPKDGCELANALTRRTTDPIPPPGLEAAPGGRPSTPAPPPTRGTGGGAQERAYSGGKVKRAGGGGAPGGEKGKKFFFWGPAPKEKGPPPPRPPPPPNGGPPRSTPPPARADGAGPDHTKPAAGGGGGGGGGKKKYWWVGVGGGGLLLIQVLLEACEDPADLLRPCPDRPRRRRWSCDTSAATRA